ncbi:GlxA family transcriptional regulator [Pseudooceanicola sp.]|uniref:GlxA family transcriptional regulator n=1 Tax=Pseudooceanicola sp. TaxID=1914328 RepID=UPI003511A3BF
MASETPLRITFLLFDGFSNMVLANAVEPLRAACNLSGRGLFRWRIATLDGASVRSSSGLVLKAETPAAAAGPADMLVLVAGYGAREQAADPQVRRLVRAAARRAVSVVGLDMGAWILAAAGLMNGRRATVHWQELDAFAEEFLEVEAVARSHVIDRDRMSAGSATSAMSLILEVIRGAAGDALAYDVSTLFVYDSAEARRAESGALSPLLGRAVREMLKHIEEPLPLGAIAERAGVAPRTLDRMFSRELGVSAGSYYRSLRLGQAQTLAAETSLPVHAIAARTGFSSAATLSRAFRGQFGLTLTASRRRARAAARRQPA